MLCYCFLRNVVDTLACGHMAWHERFGADFKGPIVPFGAEITFKTITDKDQNCLQKFGAKVLPGIFLGYEEGAGG